MLLAFESAEELLDFIETLGLTNQTTGTLSSIIDDIKKEEAPVEIVNEPKTVRRYSKTIQNALPQKICGITSNGHLILGNGVDSVYTMNDLMKLKKEITSDKSFSRIAEDYNFTTNTVGYLLYGLETGYFDKWFNEWEQIQANKFMKKAKHKKEPVNNPQKRKERGMI